MFVVWSIYKLMTNKQGMYCSLLIYFIHAFTLLEVKFINENGNEIVKPENNTNFIIVITNNGSKIFLNASNHPYSSAISMFQDPCHYKITGIFSKALGFYNSCSNELEFLYRDKSYKIKIDGQKSTAIIRPKTFLGSSFHFSSYEPTPLDGELSEVGLNQANFDLKNESLNKIDIFIFNDSKRVEEHGALVNGNTIDIFNNVKSIFSESELSIEPRLVGILNIKDKIDFINNENGPLLAFKENIEPIRFSPFNLQTALSKSDLVMLISQNSYGVNDTGNKIIHGMTFFGGSTRLDSSYSVVFASASDSNYFIAKKIAHEVGHSLGATHHGAGSIMETTTCQTCENEKRLFDEFSRDQINAFVNRNTKIFKIKDYTKYKENQILKSKKEAIEYAEERRKHTFIDIVRSRLKGKAPLGIESETSIILTVLLYTLVVIVIIFYWK
ncbi:uncharacterized protein VICG_00813 [Vittaforma corneae ATCC 50505]|uniref:Peptidase M12B domain-containing protein n=1 Tax=Vittaforma corneae (strain ATCC 50505) TaxID=993615 RepID=L2GNV5_VITCO|nr:uncharacterized protein VICG_00813 [Vittaforma corneae ATCC 50505]ELA42170.1 hypothetical protein VICG_00813 [Vittaforma corneae ATCC 50505]